MQFTIVIDFTDRVVGALTKIAAAFNPRGPFSEPTPDTGADAGTPQPDAGTPQPDTTPTQTPDAAIDARGFPWDERIHASTKTQNKDLTWRYRQKVEPTLVATVETELTAAGYGAAALAATTPDTAAGTVQPNTDTGAAGPVGLPSPSPTPAAMDYATFYNRITAGLEGGQIVMQSVIAALQPYNVDINSVNEKPEVFRAVLFALGLALPGEPVE